MPPSLQRVLVTGSAGFLGRSLVQELHRAGFYVRGLDVALLPDSLHGMAEEIVGDVSNRALVSRACEGMDAILLAHMAPNRPEVYENMTIPFDINVKGTAILLEEAVRARLRRAVLISSIAVVDGHRSGAERLTLGLASAPTSTYGLTKHLQEEIAAYHHRQNGLSVAILRPAYVTDADNLTDKYGRKGSTVNWQFIDRRDIAGAAIAALRNPDLSFGRYFLHGHPVGRVHLETEPTERDLRWTPVHDFSAYPDDPA